MTEKLREETHHTELVYLRGPLSTPALAPWHVCWTFLGVGETYRRDPIVDRAWLVEAPTTTVLFS